MKPLIAIALLVLVATGCSPSESDIATSVAATEEARPCSEKSAEYLDNVESLLNRWDDADELAGSTARIALSGSIATLQEIKQEAEQLEPPVCAEHIATTANLYMDLVITSYLAFMTDEPDHVVSMTILTSNAARSGLDLDFANLIADIPKTTKNVTYIMFGEPRNFDIQYRDASGEMVELDSEPVPWSEFIQVGEGDLLTLSTLGNPIRNSTIACAIVSDGLVVSIDSKSGQQANPRCSGNA